MAQVAVFANLAAARAGFAARRELR